MNHKPLYLLIPALLLVFTIGAPVAQEFPSKPVRIVVTFPPGGLNDIAARILAQPLTRALGQVVIVDNRPGGNSLIGTEFVAHAPADGHTLLLMGFAFKANAALRPKLLPYDTLKDFTGVARIESSPFMLAVNPSLPVKSVEELIALARARPGQLTYASNFTGSGQHLTGEMLKLMANVDIIHVPYQGDGPATMAVIAGHANILVSTIPGIVPHLATGRLRALAVSSGMRVDSLKDVPTMAESGLSGLSSFELTTNTGVVAPASTPKATINRLSAEIVRAMELPEIQDSFIKQGMHPAPAGPSEFDAVIRADIQKIQKIVQEANLRID